MASAMAAVLMAALGRAADPNWLWGNAEHCDTWFNLGEMVAMGDDARAMWPEGLRQTARSADFFLGGFLYRFLDVEWAQFLTATLWLTITVVAIAGAARRLFGWRGYTIALAASLVGWPLYLAAGTDYVNRSISAYLAIGVFGAALARTQPVLGRIIGTGAVVTAALINSTAAPAAIGVLAAVALMPADGGSPKLRHRHLARHRVISMGTGIAAGLIFSVIIGNLTGSATGFEAVSVPIAASVDFAGQGAFGTFQYYVPLETTLATSPLLAYTFLLSAPGVALLLVASVQRILARRSATTRTTRPAKAGLTIHTANCIGLATALVLQTRGGMWLSADFYVVWFVPLALISFSAASADLMRFVEDPRSRRMLILAAGLVGLLGVYSLWIAPFGFLGSDPAVAIAVALSWVLIGMAVVGTGYRSAVGPLGALGCLIVGLGLTPAGYGSAPWVGRQDADSFPYSHLTMQSAAVEGTRLAALVAGGGGVMWWLADFSDFLQSRLPRASIQCAPPLAQPPRLIRGGGAGGPFSGAPGNLTAVSPMAASAGMAIKRSERSMVIPSGQGIVIALPAKGASEGLHDALKTLAGGGVKPRLVASRKLAGGLVAVALRLRCPSDRSNCPLRFQQERVVTTGQMKSGAAP